MIREALARKLLVSDCFTLRIPPFFRNLQKRRGGILNNCQTPQNFPACGGLLERFQCIYYVFGLFSSPQAENFLFCAVWTRFPLTNQPFCIQNAQNFRLRRVSQIDPRSCKKEGGEFLIRGGILKVKQPDPLVYIFSEHFMLQWSPQLHLSAENHHFVCWKSEFPPRCPSESVSGSWVQNGIWVKNPIFNP